MLPLYLEKLTPKDLKSINKQVDSRFTTPLTLVLIPSMYAIGNDFKRFEEYFTPHG